MKLLRFCAGLIAIAAFFPANIYAQFTDDFESYTLGDVSGQGPWANFGGPETPDISTAQAFTGTHSLALSTSTAIDNLGGYGSDVFIPNINGALVTSGVWNLSFQLYIPTSFDGHFLMYLSQGTMPTVFEEGAVLRANNNPDINPAINRLSFIAGQNGTTPVRLVLDQWVEVTAMIDLDNDTTEFTYNGTVFNTGAWDIQNPGDESAIGGINFWVQAGFTPGTIFLDDLSFTGESSVLLGDVNLSGTVDFLDIGPFIAVLSGGTFQAEADVDLSGGVNFLDIAQFIAILSGS